MTPDTKQDQFSKFWPQRDGKPEPGRREFRDRDVVFRPIISHKQGRVPSSRISSECVQYAVLSCHA